LPENTDPRVLELAHPEQDRLDELHIRVHAEVEEERELLEPGWQWPRCRREGRVGNPLDRQLHRVYARRERTCRKHCSRVAVICDERSTELFV